MKIITKFHGEQEINIKEVIHFDSGIPGFPDEKEFIILPMIDTPFLVLQSIHTAMVAFIIMDPFIVFEDYEFDLPEEVLNGLEVNSKTDVAIFVILTVQEPFDETTANLQAPIILNQKNKLAKQFIINKSNYTTKHRIIQSPIPKEQEVK